MKISKYLILIISLFIISISIEQTAYSAEMLPEFNLDQVIVTATGYEKNDTDVAASTEVFTREDLEKTGETNVITALSKTLGVNYSTYGPEGASQGSKNSNLTIRGLGVLVLINGSPINLNGRYNLEDLPFDGIEHIEVIKGGGAVLYGSEAMGGVINIITTNAVKNKISVALGNRDRQQYDFSSQMNKLSVAASFKRWGSYTKTSTSSFNSSAKKMNNYLQEMNKSSLYLNYKFDNKQNILWQHTQSKKDYDYVFGDGYQGKPYYGALRYNRIYHYEKDFIQYNYHDDHFTGNIYYNQSINKTDNNDYRSSTGSVSGYPKNSYDRDKNYTYGGNINKLWETQNTNYLLGLSFQHENYNPDTYADKDYSRNNYSVYAQWDRKFDEKNNLIISGRQSWSKTSNDNLDNFSGQVQYIYKLAEDQSIYASIGQSYRVPYLRELYSNGSGYLVGNRSLKPEKGMHYELGWKKQIKDYLWKIALFKYYIKDNISYTNVLDKNYATNQDAKNIGLEGSLEHKNAAGFRYKLGLSYSNPKVKTCADNSVGVSKVKDYWDRQYGRMQFTGGIGYTKDNWDIDLLTTYMWQRVASPTSTHSFSIKPYLLSSLNIKYSFNNDSDITLSMENLFNRDDNYGGSTTAFYSTPFSFLLKYSHKF